MTVKPTSMESLDAPVRDYINRLIKLGFFEKEVYLDKTDVVDFYRFTFTTPAINRLNFLRNIPEEFTQNLIKELETRKICK